MLVALMCGGGQGDTRMEVDGQTFQFPQWVMSAIHREIAEAVGNVGSWNVIEQCALPQLATIPKQRAARKQVQDTLGWYRQ